jgi:hypothetical protein
MTVTEGEEKKNHVKQWRAEKPFFEVTSFHQLAF